MTIIEQEINIRKKDVDSKPEFLFFPEYGVEIPVYDIRNISDQEVIACEIAKGNQMAMFGGVWGGFQGIKELGLDNSDEYLKWAKKDRPKETKYVVMKPPGSSHELIDWSKVHEEFKYLEDPESFESLWNTHGAYLHLIAPINEDALPEVFITTPEEHAKSHPDKKPISTNTAAFLWRSDPYFENFAKLLDNNSENPTHIGVTSLNKHGEKPPYTFDEFVNHLRQGKADPREVHLVVRDSIYELSQALGSHTQLRLPHVDDEDGFMEIYRIGTLSPEGFVKKTGIELKHLPGVKDVRKIPGGNLDMYIDQMNMQIQKRWEAECSVRIKIK